MALRTRPRFLAFAVLASLLAAGYWGAAIQHPAGPRSARVFDPERLAALELGMWQAYYRKEKPRLFGMLVATLREQFRYPWTKATSAGFYLARAAATFGEAKGDYERVLPDLERAYTIARDWTGSTYDPAAVARAELGWWVARREPAHNSPENVGRLIAELYARFYEVAPARVAGAGLARAKAAALRDRGGAFSDWPAIEALLRDSYRELHAGVQAP
jgi:hypothetical protein